MTLIHPDKDINPSRPPYGDEEILINIVDYTAKNFPQALYAEIPVSPTSYDSGYRKITYDILANAVNGVAWWLDQKLGPGKDFETLAYFGPNDILYNLLVLGAVKAGYKMLLTSPRNSVPAHINLFKLTDCTIMLTPTPQPLTIPALTAAHELRVFSVPTFDELLDRRHPHYPYNKSFEQANHEPLLAFHTSGSTGLPKPVVWSHAYAATYLKAIRLDPPQGFESQDRLFQANRMFFMLPPFHAASHLSTLFNAIFNRTVMVYPLSGAIPSATLLADGLKRTKADVALVSPPLVAEISKDPSLLDFMSSNLDTLLYAGGDLPEAFGTPVTARMKLLNVYGSSELGNLPAIRQEGTWPKDDWKYIHFHPDLGLDFQHSSEDMYEMCMVRDPKLEKHQTAFKLHPHLSEFRSGDLYAPHPSKPGLWMHRGRADEIIVFLTGEKTNPVSMEDHIASHPEVRTALVIGAQRFQAALLIELMTNETLSSTEKANVIERIWPIVQQANQECPTHAKITKSHILFVDPKRPMLRAGKGTVQKRPTMELYKEDLDRLYADAEKISVSSSSESELAEHTLATRDLETISRFIRDAIKNLTGWNAVGDDDNLFVLGMDSLQSILLTRDLNQALATPEIALSTFYTNPTISSFAKMALELSVQGQQSNASSEYSRQQTIETFLEEYKNLLGEIATRSRAKELANHVASSVEANTDNQERVVILTGSTGALGSYLLQILLDSPVVTHVYCLNRSLDSGSLQIQRNEARNLPKTFDSGRVTFLTADLSKPAFDLETKTYEALLATATDFIHNAWPVNFNLPLSSFRPQLAGVVNIVDFVTFATKSPTIFFISSISSVLNYPGSPPLVSEKIVSDVKCPSPMGYGESKYLAERLLDHAATELSSKAKIVRVGQIAGPVKSLGTWNKQEWLPSLVISSLHVGAVPDSLGSSQDKIEWVPIDLLAEVLVELALDRTPHKQGDEVQVFHPLHPRPVTWKLLLPTVVETLDRSRTDGKPVETVPLDTWLRKVRGDIESKNNDSVNKNKDGGKSDLETRLKLNPAVKLLAFYEELLSKGCKGGKGDLPELEIIKTTEASPKLRNLEEIQPEWMQRWIQGWLAPEGGVLEN